MESNERAAYKRWHAERLRRAIGGNPERRQLVGTVTGKSYRTVGNWISEKKPTLPTDEQRQAIRDVLGDYDHEGDAVERAVFSSELTEDRAFDVVGYYKRRLREQREGREGAS